MKLVCNGCSGCGRCKSRAGKDEAAPVYEA